MILQYTLKIYSSISSVLFANISQRQPTMAKYWLESRHEKCLLVPQGKAMAN